MNYLIRLAQPDIFLIQETKMGKGTFLQASANFWNKGGRTIVISRGSSKGIGTLWDGHKYDFIETKQIQHWILTTLLQKDSNTQVRLFNIYALATYAKNKILLEPNS